MKPFLFVFNLFVIAPAILGQSLGLNLADISTPIDWSAQSLGQAMAGMLLFGGVGILMVIIGYKLFEQCTPGELRLEIVENQDVSATGGRTGRGPHA